MFVDASAEYPQHSSQKSSRHSLVALGTLICNMRRYAFVENNIVKLVSLLKRKVRLYKRKPPNYGIVFLNNNE